MKKINIGFFVVCIILPICFWGMVIFLCMKGTAHHEQMHNPVCGSEIIPDNEMPLNQNLVEEKDSLPQDSLPDFCSESSPESEGKILQQER